MSPLIETIHFKDGVFRNIELHQNRFDRSRIELYQGCKTINIMDTLSYSKETLEDETYKVRILYGKTIEIIK